MPSGRPLTSGFAADGAVLGWLVVGGELARFGPAKMDDSPLVETVNAVKGSFAWVAAGVGVGAAAGEGRAFRATEALQVLKALP